MKGDGFIKIKINIKGIYPYSIEQPKILIYDENGCLVEKGYAKCGVYYSCLQKCTRYKVVVIFCGKKVCSYICTDKCEFNIYLNICSLSRNQNSRTITFRLLDYYYNLPISKGVLNLGQTSNNY